MSEQGTRQKYFLPQVQETAREWFPPQGQKIIQEFLLAQGCADVGDSACGFFAAATDWAAVNQEAGDFASRNSLLFVVAAKEFVALNGGNHADGALFTGLGALHAAEATDAYRASQSDFVGQGQKNLNRRAFPSNGQ